MPSLNKILHFLSSALATSISVGVLGSSISLGWARMTMKCGQEGQEHYNGTAEIVMSLLQGTLDRNYCPKFGQLKPDSFEVIPELVSVGDAPVVLHLLVVCLLVLCFLFSAISIFIAIYNAFSNPYETYVGPIGIYTCSSLSACLSFVALIIFVLNVNVTNMAEELVKTFENTNGVDLKNKSSEMLLGYYLVIAYIGLSLIAIVAIYAYEHAAYMYRREQQRPTEDAPKEIMMY